MEPIISAYHALFLVAVLVLAVLVILSILRSVRGPRTADRIIAVNMVGTQIITIIAILSVYLNENYLVDICLIYAMISFLGVVVLCKVYTGVYLQKKHMKATLEAIEDNVGRQHPVVAAEEHDDSRNPVETAEKHGDSRNPVETITEKEGAR